MSFGQPGTVFNPPDYWTTMINDPTQPPVMIYPYGGGGGSYPYGLYPGMYYGQRTFTYDDAQRHARERNKALQWRAEHSQDPSHKYLDPDGNLDPRTEALIQRAQANQRKKPDDPVKKIQKRLVATVLIGAVLSALLK